MIYAFTSSGERISEATIKARYSAMLRERHEGNQTAMCQACHVNRAVNHSHIIAKARCKQIHKAELIYHPHNVFDACNGCHHEWEGFKSGKWIEQKNVMDSLAFLKEHDPEGYLVRVNLTQLALTEKIIDE